MKKRMIVEIYEFSPIEGITDQVLLKAIKKSQYNFFRKQNGFIRCEVLKLDKKWISIRYWNGIEEARRSHNIFLNHSSCLPFIQMISPNSEQRIYMQRELLSIKMK